MPDAEQKVVDNLHEMTDICRGADTCNARAVLEPLLQERDQLRSYIHNNMHKPGVPESHCTLCKALDGEL